MPWRLQGEGMKTFRNRVCNARLFGPAIAVLLIAGTLGPVSADANINSSLTTGGSAVIAFAQGDNVRLRSGPGYDTSEIDRFAEGTSVEVVDGPFAADDGTQWYQVSVGGQTGYMVADYLAASSSFTATSGQAVANDSVNVRAGASTSDAVVTTLVEGDVVTLTGGNRNGWISVSARGGDGWVFGDYLGATSAPAPSPEQPGEPTEPAPQEPTGETRYALEQVHLRSGPGTEYPSVASLVVGVEMQLTGKVENGFASVTSGYGDGWVYAQYIGPVSPGAPVDPEPTAAPTEAPTEDPGTTGTRYTIDTVHLRSGPSTSSESITHLEIGVQLELTGEQGDGFVQVTSDFGTGWVAAQYIGTEAPSKPVPTTTPEPTTEPTTTPEPTTEPEPTTTPEPTAEPQEPVSRWTTANVNLRSESSETSSAITVITAGTELSFSGVTANGFSQVTATAGTGWIASEFLSETRPEAPAEPGPSDSLLTWPVRGGEWSVLQGYNGSSHQNRSSSWQYYYSLDLIRSDGSTAGQPVYSPVSGTMRWIDEASGGGSIYMGDGLAFAFFHAVMDPSIQEGDTITQGQYLGTIAPAGQFGAGSTPHLHITIWQTSDGGNWSRIAIPFTGNVSIAGTSFPATSGGNQWRGFTFTP
jgi:uncharacterized protein YgiM (DUF1202 family)